MSFSCVLKTLAFVCAFAWTSSYNESDIMDYILNELETARSTDSFSSKDIPSSLSNRGVITDKWLTYIRELVSKFGNGNSMAEVLLHLHLNVKRAFHWCKPNQLSNYILAVNFTQDQKHRGLKKYYSIPCGKVVFSKSSTDQYRTYVHFISLARGEPSASVEFGLNLTIHSFISSEHKQYLTGDMTETMCSYVTLGIVYEHNTPSLSTSRRYIHCGEIIRKDMIFQQGKVGIVTGSKNPNATFQLTIYYQALSLASIVYADKPEDLYSYHSSSTFYPNLWYFEIPKIEAIIVSLIRWHIKAVIGQNINLVVSKTSECQDDLEAISIYDGPVKVYDEVVCTVTKEPAEPTAPSAQTKPTAQNEPPAQTEQSEPIVVLVSYTSTFNSIINYCLNIVQHPHIFFTFEVQSMNSTKIHVEHDQKYQLQVSSGTKAIYYRSWQFTSDAFIRLELAVLRQFRGLTQNCLFGGMVLNDIGNPFDLQHGSICTTYQGYEPLFSTPYWYFNRHGGVLTVYAFYNYFTIDIDLILTSQRCEGITNICSTHCM